METLIALLSEAQSRVSALVAANMPGEMAQADDLAAVAREVLGESDNPTVPAAAAELISLMAVDGDDLAVYERECSDHRYRAALVLAWLCGALEAGEAKRAELERVSEAGSALAGSLEELLGLWNDFHAGDDEDQPGIKPMKRRMAAEIQTWRREAGGDPVEPAAVVKGGSLYDDLVALGVEISSHESDLYTPATAEAVALVKKHGAVCSYFRNQLNGAIWIDVPFGFDPWWIARLG